MAEINHTYKLKVEGSDFVKEQMRLVHEEADKLQKSMKDAGSEMQQTGDKFEEAGEKGQEATTKWNKFGQDTSKNLSILRQGLTSASGVLTIITSQMMDATTETGKLAQGFGTIVGGVLAGSPGGPMGMIVGGLTAALGVLVSMTGEASKFSKEMETASNKFAQSTMNKMLGLRLGLGMPDNAAFAAQNAISTATGSGYKGPMTDQSVKELEEQMEDARSNTIAWLDKDNATRVLTFMGLTPLDAARYYDETMKSISKPTVSGRDYYDNPIYGPSELETRRADPLAATRAQRLANIPSPVEMDRVQAQYKKAQDEAAKAAEEEAQKRKQMADALQKEFEQAQDKGWMGSRDAWDRQDPIYKSHLLKGTSLPGGTGEGESIEEAEAYEKLVQGLNDQVEALMEKPSIPEILVPEVSIDLPTWYEELGMAMQDVGKQAQTTGEIMMDAMKRATSSMADAIVKFVETGKLSFKSLVTSIMKMILEMVLNQQIAKFVSWIGGGLAGGFGGGAVAGAKALGGPVQGGRPILVGERGPELFVPPSNGSIQTGMPGAAFSPVITLQIGSVDSNARAVQLQNETLEMIRNEFINMQSYQARYA